MLAVSVLILKTSLDSIITFDPLINSREDPAGTGAFLKRNTSSPVLVTKKTSTSALDAVLLETNILRRTNVAELPAVKTFALVLVCASVTQLDFVSTLKVFAILS